MYMYYHKTETKLEQSLNWSYVADKQKLLLGDILRTT